MKVCACGCGVEFTPRKSTGIYATPTCRVRGLRAKRAAEKQQELLADAGVVAQVVAIGARGSRRGSARDASVDRSATRGSKRAPARRDASRSAAANASSAHGERQPGRLEAQLAIELGDAGETSLGLQALLLARRIDDGGTSASALRSLSQQIVVLTAAALRDQAPDVEVDPVAAVQAQVLEMRRQFTPNRSAG